MKNSLVLKNLLFQAGVMSLCRRINKRGTVAILRYHSIVEPQHNYYASPSICIAPQEFEAQVRYLSENYNIISLDTVANCISKYKRFPEKAVVLTFDDGYRDNYHAYQIMKHYGVQGTFYIVSGCLNGGESLWLFEVIYLVKNTLRSNLSFNVKGADVYFTLLTASERGYAIQRITEIIKSNNLEVRENIRKQLLDQAQDVQDFCEKASQVMMSWEQVQEMSSNGMSIGGHTMTHLNLPNVKKTDAIKEINGCKEIIEEKIGTPVRHFSYPNGGNYGHYDDTIMKIVKSAGYMTATTSNNGVIDLTSNLFELSRIRITNNLSEIVYQMDCEPIVNRVLRVG